MEGILEAQGVPDENELVEEAEDVEGKEGRNGARLGGGVGVAS